MNDVVLKPMERQLIPTGIAIALPEGYEAQIRPRSGLALKHGISLVNTPGTIDADYRGEIKVLLINLGRSHFTVRAACASRRWSSRQYRRRRGSRLNRWITRRVQRAASVLPARMRRKRLEWPDDCLPKKLYYAVEAVLYIAYNAGNGPISSRDIAEKQGLPPRYLEQLMQRLVHGGVLRGVRGPHGGYMLARERRRITVGDICAVLKEEDERAGRLWRHAARHKIVLPGMGNRA